MGDTELLYVTLAILFFGGITTSINKYMIMNNEDAINNQYEYQAVSIAQEVIESVKSRKFDENIFTLTGINIQRTVFYLENIKGRRCHRSISNM